MHLRMSTDGRVCVCICVNVNITARPPSILKRFAPKSGNDINVRVSASFRKLINFSCDCVTAESKCDFGPYRKKIHQSPPRPKSFAVPDAIIAPFESIEWNLFCIFCAQHKAVSNGSCKQMPRNYGQMNTPNDDLHHWQLAAGESQRKAIE